jgi:hypothetical protein
MQTIATIGLNIANSVFQVHGVDAAGRFIDPLASFDWSATARRLLAPPA